MSTTTPVTQTTPTPTKVTFGVPSLLKETPTIARTVAQGTVYAVGIINLALVAFPQIPDSVKATVAGYSGGALVFVNGICSMFGIQVNVPQTHK
jgi:hypothetical protein